jgi:hypothetical protein
MCPSKRGLSLRLLTELSRVCQSPRSRRIEGAGYGLVCWLDRFGVGLRRRAVVNRNRSVATISACQRAPIEVTGPPHARELLISDAMLEPPVA